MASKGPPFGLRPMFKVAHGLSRFGSLTLAKHTHPEESPASPKWASFRLKASGVSIRLLAVFEEFGGVRAGEEVDGPVGQDVGTV